MSDRPIIFSAPMVKALLEGRKTQTRRILKPQPDTASDPSGNFNWGAKNRYGYWAPANEIRPYALGDRLWVRESHSVHGAMWQGRSDGQRWGPWGGLPTQVSPDRKQIAYFREGFDRSGAPRWRPSIHMPRWASRLTLTVTGVRVQRLQEISRGDAMEEGCPFANMAAGPDPRDWFHELWNSIHGPAAWDANPWSCAVSFTVEKVNIDRMAASPGPSLANEE